MKPPRVLCVDDDHNLLEAMRRSLKGDFELVTATGGVEGLRRLREDGPFAVVISDLRMPVIDGITLLREVAESSPDSVRVLLTGNADVTAAVSAINEGQLFRFLTKPCPAKYLHATIVAAIQQHALVTSERVLLHDTLCTSMRSLADLACLVRPEVATRVQQARRLATGLSESACPRHAWVCEIGMLLLVTSWVTLPESVMERAERPGGLLPSDHAQLGRLPELATRLVDGIPRLDLIRESLDRLRRPMSADDAPAVRVLRLLWDYEHERSEDRAVAMETLRRHGHEEALVDRLLELLLADEHAGPTVELRLCDLQPGMVLADSVFDETGALLIGRGTEVGPGLVEHIRNYWTEASGERLVPVRASSAERREAA